MGMLLSRPPPETGLVGGPGLRTPLTDITAPFGHWNTYCGGFEIRFLDCVEAHGHIKGEEKCKFLFQDFQECTKGYKQMKRVQLMREERHRQGFAKLMKGEKGKWFADAPAMDSFSPEPRDSF